MALGPRLLLAALLAAVGSLVFLAYAILDGNLGRTSLCAFAALVSVGFAITTAVLIIVALVRW